MADIIFFMLYAGAGVAVFFLAYMLFEFFIFLLYKHNGGKLDLISYFRRL